MKVLVFGAKGMLGRDLMEVLGEEHEARGIDIEECDITVPEKVSGEVGSFCPEVVIHTAAYTDVDGCESKKDLAFAINAEGTRNIAVACAAVQAKLFYISTDYVFDGEKPAPYLEEDLPSPLNIYGNSKLAGERYIQENLRRYLIIRTEWLYGHHGKNFVRTITNLAGEREELRVVHDQRGAPTFTRDLAQAMAELLTKNVNGILHLTNRGSCTWYELALEILRIKPMGKAKVIPISSAELNRPAKRPANSVLDCSRFLQATGKPMRTWEKALQEYLMAM